MTGRIIAECPQKVNGLDSVGEWCILEGMELLRTLLQEVLVPLVGIVLVVLLRQVSCRLGVVAGGQAVVADTVRLRYVIMVSCSKALDEFLQEPLPAGLRELRWKEQAVWICHDVMLSSGMDPKKYQVRGLVDAWAFRHRELVERIPEKRR